MVMTLLTILLVLLIIVIGFPVLIWLTLAITAVVIGVKLNNLPPSKLEELKKQLREESKK